MFLEEVLASVERTEQGNCRNIQWPLDGLLANLPIIQDSEGVDCVLDALTTPYCRLA